MNIHWLIPGNYKAIEDVSNSNIASIRMRVGLFSKYTSKFQKKLTVGDHVDINADIIVIGKIGMDCHNGRDNLWFRYLIDAHKKSKKIIIDYTDNHLELNNSPAFNFYKKILPITNKAVVPSFHMSALLAQFFNNEIDIIEDPIEIESIPSKSPLNHNLFSFLWFGHATNVSYLIKYLQNKTLCDVDFRMYFLSNKQGIDLILSENKFFRANIDLNISEWTLQNMIDASKNSDACLIPSDPHDPRKSGVSSNRLITAFALGLPVSADLLKSYIPFSEYFHNIRERPLSEFIEQQEFYVDKCLLAQKNIIGHYSNDVIAQKWNSFF